MPEMPSEVTGIYPNHRLNPMKMVHLHGFTGTFIGNKTLQNLTKNCGFTGSLIGEKTRGYMV